MKETVYKMDFSAIKQNSRAALDKNRWLLIGLTLLAGAIISGGGAVSGSISTSTDNKLFNISPALMLFFAGIVMVSSCIALAYYVFFGDVISVGYSKMMLSAARNESFGIKDLFYGLNNERYWRYVGTMALYMLFIILGFMCFIVPGIIVSLGLFCVPYILAENPDVSGMEVIRMSWERMNGRKGELFAFGLSFIGWILLNALTLGILGIFFVNPYIALSMAGYYNALKGNTERI